MRVVLVAVLAASLYGAWHWWTSEREVAHPPGVLAPGEPVQIDFDGDRRIAHDRHVWRTSLSVADAGADAREIGCVETLDVR